MVSRLVLLVRENCINKYVNTVKVRYQLYTGGDLRQVYNDIFKFHVFYLTTI